MATASSRRAAFASPVAAASARRSAAVISVRAIKIGAAIALPRESNVQRIDLHIRAALRIPQLGISAVGIITDVGLPGGMNGREVANAVRARRPGLKVLFITVYGENAAIGTGRPERGNGRS